MAEVKREIESELSRELSLFQITMMGVGMMIGAGVFVCTGISIGKSGPGGILIAFALNGLIALFTGMSYAELSSAIPRAGGGYDYVRESFRGPWGFITGWMLWFAASVAGSLYAITFSLYSLHFLKGFEIFHSLGLENIVVEKTIAAIIAIIFISINYRGASKTGLAGSVMTVGQTITLAIVAIAGFVTIFRQPSRLENFTPFLPQGWGKIIVTMGFTYIAFEGYEVISHTAEEVISPKRNLPKAILYSLLIVVTTYLCIAFSVVIGIETQGQGVWEWFSQHGATGFSDAVAQLLPFGGGMLVIIAVIFSSTSALNATTYSATRVAFALGRDKYLPPILSHISKRTRIPDVALLFSSIIILGMAVALPKVEDVASGASIMFLLTFLLINLSVIKVRKDRGDELSYGYIMPFFPYIPIIAIVAQLILAIWLIDMSIIAWIVAGTWIISGFVIYYAYSKGRAIVEEEVTVLREVRELVRKEYQILVPVANPANAARLIDYAARIAKAKDGEILVMSMAIVPEQTPISEAGRFVAESEEAINEALKRAPEDIPLHSTVRYGHNAARGITGAIKEHGSNMVILGWRGRSRLRDFALGSTIDPVVEKASCDTIVVKLDSDVQPKKILVPIAGGPHSPLALEIGGIMAESFGAEITAVHVLRRDTTEQQAREMIEPILESIKDKSKIDSVKFIGPGDVVDLIIAESHDYDMIIIGSAGGRLYQQVVFGSIPERIGKESDKIVMMVKKNLGIRSWLQKWLGS